MSKEQVQYEEDNTFEVGGTYMSKMATKEHFSVDKIERDVKTGKITKLFGRWDKHPHLDNCPLNPERLIAPYQPTTKIPAKEIQAFFIDTFNKDMSTEEFTELKKALKLHFAKQLEKKLG